MKLTHPTIQCEADKTTAVEFEMPNGDIVLAYCQKSAIEHWQQEMQTRSRHSDHPIQQDRDLFPPS